MGSTLFTFKDAVEYVLDRFDLDSFDQSTAGTPSAKGLRMARRAVLNAYDLLPEKHEWNYFRRTVTIRTEAAYATGTIAYDASTRAVTLSDGTWPANAALGWLRVGDDHWFVESRDSDSQVTLRAEGAPAANVAAGTSYEWYRESYPLPCRVNHMELLHDADDYAGLECIAHGVAHLAKYNYGGRSHQRPYAFALTNDDRYADTIAVLFAPPPAEARHYHFAALVQPRPLTVYEYSTGLVTVAAGSATCTITGGSFNTATHVGSLIRFGDTSNKPTSVYGGIDDTYNPAAYERRIVAVASAGSLTLDAEITAGVTDVKFVISDPLDLYNDAMLTYFWTLACHEMAKLYYKESNAIKGFLLHEEQRALAQAQDADRFYRGPMNPGTLSGNDRSAIGTVDINDN